MNPTSYKFYTFQHRRIQESNWLTKEPLHPVVGHEWSFSSWDCSFGKFINPLLYKPKTDEPYYPFDGGQEPHQVWSVTGKHGYWTLDHAAAALGRLIVANSKGEFDFRDTYGQYCQSVRFEFRLVKVTTTEDIVEVV